MEQYERIFMDSNKDELYTKRVSEVIDALLRHADVADVSREDAYQYLCEMNGAFTTETPYSFVHALAEEWNAANWSSEDMFQTLANASIRKMMVIAQKSDVNPSVASDTIYTAIMDAYYRDIPEDDANATIHVALNVTDNTL